MSHGVHGEREAQLGGVGGMTCKWQSIPSCPSSPGKGRNPSGVSFPSESPKPRDPQEMSGCLSGRCCFPPPSGGSASVSRRADVARDPRLALAAAFHSGLKSGTISATCTSPPLPLAPSPPSNVLYTFSQHSDDNQHALLRGYRRAHPSIHVG